MTYTRSDQEKVLISPQPMIQIPPRYFIKIENPVLLNEDKKPVTDSFGQFKLRYGETEIRLSTNYPDPFPLYPGETIVGKLSLMQIVETNHALRLRASRDFVNDSHEEIKAGDEWLCKGPTTYIPRVEVEVVQNVKASIVKHGMALKIRANKGCTDHKGIKRRAGEEYLVRDLGAYLPSVDEEIVETLSAYLLTDKKALHLSATKTFTDIYGTTRKAGEEWLITSKQSEAHIVDVYECFLGIVEITTLTIRQYCVLVNPVIDNVQHLGREQLRVGEQSFFLLPGEELRDGIQNVTVLADDEALLLQAKEEFTDDRADESVIRKAGDRWMVYGPCEYVPPVQVLILESRKAMPLDENEGVYVRDTKTGLVRAVIGETYMLKPTEMLWEKPLPNEVEELLGKQSLGQTFVVMDSKKGLNVPAPRDKTKVITYRVSHNSACQIYDFKAKTSRVIFGPDLVLLGPDEQFTVLRLSGDKPKRPNVITTLSLMLGTDFMTDIIVVETSDHARLSLTLSYNWHFDVDSSDPAKIFLVRDFTGDACKALASRIRGAVASETFDDFHKHSAKIIRGSVFGLKDGKVGDNLKFSANNLVIDNVDVQAVEPVDPKTRESLQKSVQLAIEITTNSQEARAKQLAQIEAEEAKGKLAKQCLDNESIAEESRKKLLQLKAESASVESSGVAIAEARALAESLSIEANSAVERARLKAEALRIENEERLKTLRAEREMEIEYQKSIASLEIEKAQRLAEIESNKFKNLMDNLGRETLVSMAAAGPEAQAKLLGSLGLKGYLISDGKSPINLLQTAAGFIGGSSHGME